MSKFQYIIDPGHGGINPLTGIYVTPGKRSPEWEDGTVFYEGVGNREIARILADLLRAQGIDVAFTASPDDWIDWPLKTRVKKANRLHKAKPAVLISIHSNASDIPAASGFEVYTSPGESKSDKIATYWYYHHGAMFPKLKGRRCLGDGDVDKEARFTVLTDTNCPAILVETMFHTNRQDCATLQSESGKEKIALAILQTIESIERDPTL